MRAWIAAAVALVTLCSLTAAAPAPRPPNILLILADDLGYADVGFNGRREWRTPNLDRLARQGTVFSRFYAAGVVCAPSRAALITGRSPIHNGVSANYADLPREAVTLAEALKPLGYATVLAGKWHSGLPRGREPAAVHPLDQGFDEFTGYTDSVEAWEHFPKTLWFGRERRKVEGYSAALVSDHAIEAIRRHRDRPFFLHLAYIEPHLRIEAPEADVRRHLGRYPETDPQRPARARYAAMIERLDAEIGRVLDALEREGLARNTIVVFTSDHGATFEGLNEGASAFHDSNRPFRGGKRDLWEGGVRTPTIVRWPGRVLAGRRSDSVVSQLDLMPTLLAAAGGRARDVDGLDVREVWRGRAAAPERTLFWEFRAEGRFLLAAMRGDWKLVVPSRPVFDAMQDEARMAQSVGTALRPELFHLPSDPSERRSFAQSEPGRMRELQRELVEWLATETEASKRPVDNLEAALARARARLADEGKALTEPRR